MKNDNLTSRRDAIRHLALLPFVGTAFGSGISPVSTAKKAKSASLIPVMITPFRSDKSIDWRVFDQLTDFYEASGADGYFANCLSSEMYLLTPEERLAVTDRVVKRMKGKKPVVSTGSFGDTLKEKSEFVKKISDKGAEAVILITSHFAEKSDHDRTLIQNMEQLLEQTDNIPLGTYECPSPYKRVLTPEVFSFLAKNKRFIYHKDTSEDIDGIKTKLTLLQDGHLQFYNAHTASAVASLRAGGAGLSPVSANFYPEILNWICDHAKDPTRKDDADWIQSEVAATEPLISKGYPVSSKYFLKKRGIPMETLTRLPRNPLTTAQTDTLDQVHARFLGWCDRLRIKPTTI